MEDPKKQVMKEIDGLIGVIKRKLHNSTLLSTNKNLNGIAQPKLLKGELKDYQLQSLKWMAELAKNGLSGILADDMGLGKTIQTIAYFTYLQQTKGVKGKHLIVVPKNVLCNWKREIQKWNPTLSAVILPGTEKQRDQTIQTYIRPSKFDVLIATYYSVQLCETALKKFKWETMIVDEAHSIKNEETYLAHCLRRFKFNFALLLTGTPLSNQLKQLWSLLNFIAPEIFQDNSLFRRIQDSVNINCKDDNEKIKYQSEIAGKFKAIISPFLLRRVKGEVNLGLKQKKQITLFISLSQLQLRMYRNYLKTRSVYGDQTRICMGRAVQLRKICCHPYLFSDIQNPQDPPYGEHLIQNSGKLKLLDKLLKKLLRQKHKILIFSQFVMLLKVLQDYCAYRNYKYSVITGVSSLDDRDSSVQQFSNSTDTNIFLISTRAGGIGLNLIAADVVILYDMDWNPQMDRQAMDRAYRIGQKNNVLVFKLVSNNTVEERMLEVQKYKIIWDQLVIQKGGLARFKQAEEKFQKIDQNHIAGLGSEQIFKLQQDFDEKTIDQIITLSMAKDTKKTEQIRSKLQKEYEKLAQIANPYQSLEKQSENIKGINYQPQIIMDKKKKKGHKPNWKQRQHRDDQIQKKTKQYIEPKAYHLFKDKETAGKILYQLSVSQVEQQSEDCLKKLNEMGFYNWSNLQYKSFVSANLKYSKQDYSNIAKQIQTKNVKQVKKYSKTYFEVAQRINQLARDYNKITKKQQQMQKLRQKQKIMKQYKEKIKSYPSHLFNLKTKSAISNMTIDSMVRLYFNGVKESGVCLDQCESILEQLNPNLVRNTKRKFAGANQLNNFHKIVQQMQDTAQQQISANLNGRYEALKKKYVPAPEGMNQKNKRVEILKEQQQNDSAQTALKE